MHHGVCMFAIQKHRHFHIESMHIKPEDDFILLRNALKYE